MSHNSAFQISPSSPDQTLFQHPCHPKIKPLIQKKLRDEIPLNESQLQKNLKRNSKTPRAFQSVPEKFRNPPTRYIKRFFKLLKSQHSPSKLEYSLPKMPIFEATYLFSKLRHPSLLTTLKLSIQEFNISVMKRLAKSLSLMKSLNRFDVIFKNLENRHICCLHKILSKLFYLKRMTSLSIEFRECFRDYFSLGSLIPILKKISHIKQLRSLRINSMHSSSRPDIVRSFPAISKLAKLTQIDLGFSGKKNSGAELVKLFQSFRNLKELSDISLNLVKCIFDKTDIEPLSQALNSLENPSLIKKLHLAPYLNFKDQDVLPVARALKRFTSLKFLNFQFPYRTYGQINQGLSELGPSLKDLVSLSHFCLSLPLDIKGGALDIESILKALHKLTSVKILCGGFGSSKIFSSQQFTSGLRALKALKSLHIHCYNPYSLPNEDLESLAESLQELVCLNDLSLKFNSLRILKNQKVESLSNAVKKPQNLSDLCLDFGFNHQIEEKAVDKISETLRFLPNLYSVTFRFISKEKSQEDTCQTLFDVLRERKNIRKVTLTLNQTKFNEEGIKKLEECRSFESFIKNLLAPEDIK